MAEPSAQSVLGNFNGQRFSHAGVTTQFTREASQYFISVQNEGGAKRTFAVAYAFGHYPLQQYLIDIGNGKLQAYDVAWDSRTKEQGGQRWFKLLADEDTGPGSAFHWQSQLNNWNSRCVDCHSTEVKKNYNENTQSYDTQFSEINIGCEACHGPGTEHKTKVKNKTYKSGTNSGFSHSLKPPRGFQFTPGQSIAQAQNEPSAKAQQTIEVDTCGGCHSRRQIIADIHPGKSYHDQYRLSLLQEPLYFPAGEVQDEVFVLGSFMQSKMFHKGVTCTHCHDPHSGDIKMPAETLCAQCHAPATYATQTHHKHKPGTEASQCVSCHMPATVFMEVDARRDHSFSVPSKTITEGTPHACTQCHDANIAVWSQSVNPFGSINQKARDADPTNLRSLADYIANADYPVVRRATLLELAANVPSRVSVEIISQNVSDQDPLVRRAAVDAADFMPLEMRWALLNPLISDPSASVRYSLAQQLAPTLAHLPPQDQSRLNKLIKEHLIQLEKNNDSPAGLMNLANFQLALGDTDKAINQLLNALQLEPNYIVAHLNLADIYRSQNNVNKESHHLQKALDIAPDSAAAQHAYGLFLIRQQKKELALTHLQKATQKTDSTRRFFYVYAVALDSEAKTDHAIETLQASNKRWPKQFDTLMLLVQYLEKAGRESESWDYLSDLSQLAPNDPEVKLRVNALRQSETPPNVDQLR